MKTSPIRYSLFAASAILLLTGCVKMPKPGTQNPEEPDNPDSPPRRNTSILSAMNPGR